ncbi:LysM peptidoglycan-binding domain-containing protein, partial [Singulisphaera acidiphila]
DDAMALSSAPPEIKPGEGIPIPNAGKGRSLEDDLPVKLAPAAAVATGASMTAAGAVAAKAEETEVDPLTPELHVVQSGENFWTISKYYYNSGRFYVALWKANSRTVSAPDQLAVGQTIVIPPPEALDRTLIAPPRKTSSSASRGSSQIRKTSRSKSNENDSGDTAAQSSSEVELILPIDNSMISRRSRLQSAEELDPPPGKRYQVSRPRYKVRAHETLRSIARDTLNDARRADEIYDLNRDILNDDPRNLVEGQILELPEEARVGRSSQ